MSVKRCITLLICFIILFCIIGSGCSQKEDETITNKTADDQTLPANEDEDTAEASEDKDTVEASADDDIGKASEDEDTAEASEGEDMGEESEREAASGASEGDDTSEASDNNETNEEAEKEDSSPWILVSDSSVTTRVSYAGFINEKVGITVGYAGATSYTEDGGNSWSVSDNVSACRYGLDYYDENFIVTGGNSGVNLLSEDKGISWTPLADFPLKSDGVYNKFLSVLDKDNIYIASMLSFGVSSDGGLTWKELEVPEGCTKIAGMFFLTPDIGYLLNSDGTLYKTKDSCKSWTMQTIDLSGEEIPVSDMPSTAINFQDEEHGKIVYTTKSYKLCGLATEDGGSTWEPIIMPEAPGLAPYLTRDGRYLTLSSVVKRIYLYKLEAK